MTSRGAKKRAAKAAKTKAALGERCQVRNQHEYEVIGLPSFPTSKNTVFQTWRCKWCKDERTTERLLDSVLGGPFDWEPGT